MSDYTKCESCGMPMRTPEDFGGGRTDNPYCIHCTDSNGTLKPYEEVLKNMKNFAILTLGVTESEALKMAQEGNENITRLEKHQKINEEETVSNLTKLPNIGKVLAERLEKIGVSTQQELADLGSVEAVIRMQEENLDTCYSMLYALEGAIQGIRWHAIPKEERNLIKQNFDQLRTEKI